MKIIRRLLKVFLYVLAFLLLLLAGFGIYVYHVSDIKPPVVAESQLIHEERHEVMPGVWAFKGSYLRQNTSGLYEMYLHGNGFERGVAFGKLGKELVQEQEQAFTDEIQRMIPSRSYLWFLKYVVGFMNRDLPDHVIPEYKQEIYGVSLSASERFNWIGSNYARQLNYHAAHDIGHALANMMLVGCSSFATWGDHSEEGQLIVGRNFDFYVGDAFARNKIVAFYAPSEGKKFISVTWPGFTGVVSGMNESGLTVTINAAKSSIPFGAATPVSLVAREILQYASTISEAVAIASKRKMFVSESFLIASAQDHKAVIIEKTPSTLDVYESGQNELICTNHYQSQSLGDSKLNQEQKQNSASVYRYERLNELLTSVHINSPSQTAAILRDYRGKGNQDIGLGNEKALNQFIAHHSIIFEPERLLAWVSTSPWQEGEYRCYDLKKIFAHPAESWTHELDEVSLRIPADPFIQTKEFAQFKQYRQLRNAYRDHTPILPMQVIQCNPHLYDAYRLAGDVYRQLHQNDSARWAYKQALQLEVATLNERHALEEKLLGLKP